jgi:hypothetical protein
VLGDGVGHDFVHVDADSSLGGHGSIIADQVGMRALESRED